MLKFSFLEKENTIHFVQQRVKYYFQVKILRLHTKTSLLIFPSHFSSQPNRTSRYKALFKATTSISNSRWGEFYGQVFIFTVFPIFRLWVFLFFGSLFYSLENIDKVSQQFLLFLFRIEFYSPFFLLEMVLKGFHAVLVLLLNNTNPLFEKA